MKNFFKGISVSQIIAGALAAVTSFLLSIKIGIGGSVIGVAVGSVVSAVASQIYQNIIKESGKKLQDGTSDSADEIIEASGAEAHTRAISVPANSYPRASASPASHESSAMSTLRLDGTSASLAALAKKGEGEPENGGKEQTETTVALKGETLSMEGGEPDATSVLQFNNAKTMALPTVKDRQKEGVVDASGTANAMQQVRGEGTSHQNRSKRIAVIVAVVSALLAVGVTAAVISLVTKGQGTDNVVRDFVANSTTESPEQHGGNGEQIPQKGQKDDSVDSQKNSGNDQNGAGTLTGPGSSLDSGSSNGSGSIPNSETSEGDNSLGSGNGSSKAPGNSKNADSGTNGSGSGTTGVPGNNGSTGTGTGSAGGDGSGTTNSPNSGGGDKNSSSTNQPGSTPFGSHSNDSAVK